jgi:hypothetical protein
MKSILQLLVLSVLALCVTAQYVQQFQDDEEALIEQGPWQQQIGQFGEEPLVDESNLTLS